MCEFWSCSGTNIAHEQSLFTLPSLFLGVLVACTENRLGNTYFLNLLGVKLVFYGSNSCKLLTMQLQWLQCTSDIARWSQNTHFHSIFSTKRDHKWPRMTFSVQKKINLRFQMNFLVLKGSGICAPVDLLTLYASEYSNDQYDERLFTLCMSRYSKLRA